MYSFSMIAYQLFELMPPFSGMDPVDAARKAALAEERPPLLRLATQMPTYRVRGPEVLPLLITRRCLCCERSHSLHVLMAHEEGGRICDVSPVQLAMDVQQGGCALRMQHASREKVSPPQVRGKIPSHRVFSV